jgi:hypothetical protein
MKDVAFGINWGLPTIPDGWRKRLGARKRFEGSHGKVTASLQGVCFTPADRDEMVSTATNGHREIFVVEKRTAGPTAYAIYTY